jgi:phosphoribosylaminoimidazolecarboxamide formyltransferase / IMP cyclohydrolase
MDRERIAQNLDRLRANRYPGRGIVQGMSPDGSHMLQVYWLTGRSENSRNRIFVQEPDGIRTQAHDPAKLVDPSLIIYWPARRVGSIHLVTNGDQTDTLFHMMQQGSAFEDALMTRTFEPDAPNYTPRISGMLDASDPEGGYRLSILKSFEGSPESCVRCFYRYDKGLAGIGHCIHTYQEDGNPLPTFSGDPYPVPLPGTAEEAADLYWPLLDENNRVALFVRSVNRTTGAVDTVIRNRHGQMRPVQQGRSPLMKEIGVKYGCNPHQKPSRLFVTAGELPLTVLNGTPSYINYLDALHAWQLVRELREATGLPAAASFKHVSPAGAAVAVPLSPALARACHVEGKDLSPVAQAYARARGADRVSSFGDFIAISDTVDVSLAELLAKEVSDGIVAPAFEPEALEKLMAKRKGSYVILQMDPAWQAPELERRDVFGITLEQKRNDVRIEAGLFSNPVTRNRELPEEAVRDLLIATITLKYTQSNSICFAIDGQVIGVGAGQQSRIHCTRLAAGKADIWMLRQHPTVLHLPFVEGLSNSVRDNAVDQYLRDDVTEVELAQWRTLFREVPQKLTTAEKAAFIGSFGGVAYSSDAFIPFRDNIDRAAASGARYVAQAGGSVRDGEVVDAADAYGMVMCMTGLRLFHH